MKIDKEGSKTKNGNYVGGLLQMFDWNAKSRKKSDLPGKSKQKKKFEGNFPATRLQMQEDYEILAGSSMKSDYSRASSATDDEFYETRAPGVVARLMGLDSMPHEPYTNPLFDSQSLPGSLNNKTLDYYQDPQIMLSTTLHDAKHQNASTDRPAEKFQTEVLPPKSAKSVPITRQKIPSPTKGSNSIPPKDASTKKGSKKVQKHSKIMERSKSSAGESNAVKNLKGQSTKKSWNGSVDATSSRKFRDLERNKGKSISLALQAKANVQKREGINKKEASDVITNQIFTAQSEVEKNKLKKPSTLKKLNVLTQNNQKQNCSVSSGKSPPKSSLSGDSCSSRRQRDSSKVVIKDDKKKALSCSSERVARKKRTVDGNHTSQQNRTAQIMRKGRNGKDIQSSPVMHAHSSWNEDSEKIGADVISFTFTTPIAQSGHGSVRSTDFLRTIFVQKLKELSHNAEVSEMTHETFSRDYRGIIGGHNFKVSMEEIYMHGGNTCDNRKLLERLPSPVSALDHSSFTDSCYSSETAESNIYSTSTSDLSDSASSTSAVAVATKRQTTLSTLSYQGKPRNWQLSYVKEILCNVEMMFNDYASGKACEIITPSLFHQLEIRKGNFINGCGRIPRINRRLLFDCVTECLEMRCKSWIKGLSVVSRKEKLAEDVYKEISDWSSMGDFMVDELVDNDMSSKYGRWLDFEVEAFELGMKIESHTLDFLIDEVVGDMLLTL